MTPPLGYEGVVSRAEPEVVRQPREKTKFMLIAYFFPPVGGAGVQRALSFARYLPEEGLVPTVISAPAPADDRWAPPDETLAATIPSEVPVHRVPGPVPRAGRWSSRLARWAFVPTPYSRWWIRGVVDLGERIATSERLILATMSPFESGEAARRLAQRLGLPWVADLRDPWALDEMQVYPSALHRKIELRRMERLLSTASAIVMNTPEATTSLLAALPRLRRIPVVTITNGFDSADFDGPAPARDDGKFRIVHTGYLHTDSGRRFRRSSRLLGGTRGHVDILTRSHVRLLEALEEWCERRPELRDQVELVLAGSTTDDDRRVALESGVSSLVRFPGYLSHAESVDLVRTADLLFLPMHNLGGGERSRIVPGKTYEYMAARRPILAAVPDGDARDFVEKCGMAFVCRPDDVAGMTRVLDQVHAAWARREPVGQPDEEYLAQFDRRHLARQVAVTLFGVLPGVTPLHDDQREAAVGTGRTRAESR